LTATSDPASALAIDRPSRSDDRGGRLAVRVMGLSKAFPLARTWREAARHPRKRTLVSSLSDVTFDVAPGEFFGLLGPNGAGKTTLFRLLATSIIPDAGTAQVLGFDLLDQPRDVRRVLTPVLTNEGSLNWRLSARENLRLFAAFYGIHGRAAIARADQVLDVVQLSDVGEKMVGRYSSGMRQRLLIARALLSNPKVLLLDEPTRSLDPVSARGFREFLRTELSERQGCTVLLATHSADEALRLCDRVGILDRGRLLTVGSPPELLRSFGDERLRVWTSEPSHPVLATMRRPRAAGESPLVDGPWEAVDVDVPGGMGAAAELLVRLVQAGVPIARYERLELTLAELIERVIARGR
jgi:ABC-2 type transport system ATP-binding protein